uniref:Uncharacterized protein n=1 Tax=Arundo donax TaxID=35708 RepID=A0A0A9BJZ4_ARUDO
MLLIKISMFYVFILGSHFQIVSICLNIIRMLNLTSTLKLKLNYACLVSQTSQLKLK